MDASTSRRISHLWHGVVQLRASVEQMQQILEKEFAHQLGEDEATKKRFVIPEKSWNSIKMTLPTDSKGKLVGLKHVVRFGRKMESVGVVKGATEKGFWIQPYNEDGTKKAVSRVWRNKKKVVCGSLRKKAKP